MTHKNKTYWFVIHVIDNNTDNLLSRDTAYKMGLVTVVANVNRWIKGDPVKITQCKNVVPYCTPTSWCILFPILPKVKKGALTLRERWHYRKSHQTNGLVLTHWSSKGKKQKCQDSSAELDGQENENNFTQSPKQTKTKMAKY